MLVFLLLNLLSWPLIESLLMQQIIFGGGLFYLHEVGRLLVLLIVVSLVLSPCKFSIVVSACDDLLGLVAICLNLPAVRSYPRCTHFILDGLHFMEQG